MAVVIGLGSLVTRGLNLGIDFEGGVVWEVPAGDASVGETRDAVDELGLAGAKIHRAGERRAAGSSGSKPSPLDAERSDEVTNALADLTGSDFDDVTLNEVGAVVGQGDHREGRARARGLPRAHHRLHLASASS